MFTILNTHLSNGLRILIRKTKNTKTVSCGLWIDQGVKNETKDENGISHVCEHMAHKTNSTNTSKSINELFREIHNNGIRYNGATTKDYTSYYLDGTSKEIKLMIETLSALVVNKVEVDSDILESEKKGCFARI